MCLIIAVNEKTPPESQFELANDLNPDGIGMAWIAKNGMVQWYKGLGIADVKKMAPYTPLPYVVHFRIATSGGINRELCHPFPISRNVTISTDGQAKRVMFHNGIWFDWREMLIKGLIATGRSLPQGPWSDTRAMAFLAYHYGDKILELLEEKIVVLSKEGSQFYGSGWTTRDGCVYSNPALFMPVSYYQSQYTGAYQNYQHWTEAQTGGDLSRSRASYALGSCEDGWEEDLLNDALRRGSKEVSKTVDTTWFKGKQYKFGELE